MALNDIEKARFERAVREYVEKRRPAPHIRPQLDVGYRFTNQSVELFEIRPMWREPEKKIEHSIAKATFVRSRRLWRVYWKRADLKWHSYEPHAEVKSIDEFLPLLKRISMDASMGNPLPDDELQLTVARVASF